LLAGAAGGAFAQTSTPAKPACFSSLSNWFYTSAADCPFSDYGLTFYGTVDVGFGYETHAAPFNGDAKTGVGELISKINKGSGWEPVPSGLSQSNVGLKIKEQLAPGWFFIGDVNAGFDPVSLKLAYGPK